MTNAKFRVKNGLIVDEVSSNTGNFTILDGTVTSDAGITLATGSDGNIALSPDAGGKVTIDEPFQISPAGAVYVDLDASAQGSNSTTLVGDAGNFDAFPASGSVYIETTTSGENPYAYTGKSATGHQLTGLSGLDSISAANVMVTLAPEAIDINGKAAVTSQTGQFPADGGQITIDGGKWGNAANDWAAGKNYGAVVLNQAISAVKVKASDTDSSNVYKDGTHVAEYIPILKVGSDSPNALTEETDYFSARYGQGAGGSANARSEQIFFNHVNHVDTVSLMKIKSSVANTGDQDYADVLGSALVIETATGGEMNQIVFNHEPTNATRWLGSGSASLGTSDFAYAVGSVFAASGGSSTNFGMGYRGISFNTTGADAAGGFFAGSSGTYGGAGNPLASGNTFFQSTTAGLVGIGPGQEPAAFATIHVGATGATNVGGVITMDSGSADPATTANTMYNKSGNLYWGTTNLSASSASALNDLSDVSYSGGDLTITALDTLTFTAANDTAATIVMKADNSDDAGDDWTITANTGQTFTIGNDIASAGTAVTHLTITPHATAASSSVTLPGNLIMGGTHQINNATASSATQGGKLSLISDDGAALGNGHRLGVVEFAAAEDGSSSLIYGAKIQAMADAAWSATENGTRLEFYTADGNNSLGLALTIDSDKLATFEAGVNVTTDLAVAGGDLAFGNGQNATISVGDTSSGTDGRNLTISAGSAPAGSTDQNGGDLILKAGGGDGTGTSYMSFRTKVSGTDSSAERMRIHTDGNVGIGDSAPGTLLQLSGANAYLTLQNTTAEHSAGGAETKIIFEDHANAALGQVMASHVGTNDDTKGQMIFSTHTGSALTTALTLSDAQLATFAGDVTISGNDLTFGNGATIVNTSSTVLTITEEQTNFSGDIQVGGQDIKASNGTTAITLTDSGGVGVAQNLTVAGNLTVSGTTTAVQTTNMQVEDALIELGLVDGSAPGSDTSWDSGMLVNYYSSSAAKKAGFYWDSSTTAWSLSEVVAEDGSQVLTPTAGATEMRYLYDASNYHSIAVAANGATTLATVDSDGTVAHLTLDVNGDLILDTDTGINRFYKGGDTDDYASITVAANGVTTFATFDADASIGHLTFDVDGDVILDPATGVTVFKDNGTTYGLQDHANVTVAQGSGVTVDTFLCTTYQATKYLILVSDQDNNNFMTCELLVLGDDVDSAAYLTQYAVVYNDTTDKDLGVFTATESGNTITLTYTANDTAGSSSNGHKVRAVATRIAAHS